MDSALKERLLSGGYAFREGAHSPGDEMCVMEAAAYIAGEEWSDHPKCVSPIIASFMRAWNDDLESDEDRQRLLGPLLRKVIGTATTEADDLRRSWMAFDWLMREHLSEWLSLTDGLRPHADALRGLDEIDASNFDAVLPILKAAGDAAWAAARAAAGDAAWAAARAAAGDAAGDAAGAAAGAAARDAAWAAAGAAAWAAAWDAAGAALPPAKTKLQASASALVERMCAVGRNS